MTKEEKLVQQLEQLALDTGQDHMRDMWLRFLADPEIRLNMQRGLLCLSVGFRGLGKDDASQHFWDAAGYIAGLSLRIEEDQQESN